MDIQRLHGIFLNAGIFEPSSFDEEGLPLFDKHLQINFRSNISLLKTLSPFLVRDESSVLINTSDQAFRFKPRGIAYSCSKAALHALGRGLAVEWAPRGIRVNMLVPGGTDTPLYRQTKTGYPPESIIRSQKKYPIGRIATAKEVAQVAFFLLVNHNAALTGSDVRVDGALGCL